MLSNEQQHHYPSATANALDAQNRDSAQPSPGALAYADFLSRNLGETCQVRLHSAAENCGDLVDVQVGQCAEHPSGAGIDQWSHSEDGYWVGAVCVIDSLHAQLKPALLQMAAHTTSAKTVALSQQAPKLDCPYKILYANQGWSGQPRRALDAINGCVRWAQLPVVQRPHLIHVRGHYFFLRNERAAGQNPTEAYSLINHRARLSFSDSEVLRLALEQLRNRVFAVQHFQGLLRRSA